jgi:hypothetical protein
MMAVVAARVGELLVLKISPLMVKVSPLLLELRIERNVCGQRGQRERKEVERWDRRAT